MKTPTPITLTAAAALALSLALSGCSGGDDAQPQETTGDQTPSQSAEASPEDSDDSAQQSAPANSSGLAENADLSAESPTVTPEDAITAAEDEAGDGTVHAIELDYDRRDGAWQYEVKILAGSTDVDVEIDAESGDVVNVEKDDADDKEVAIDLADPMTCDEALDLASQEGSGRLTSWKLESDDDRIEYQFDYEDGGRETEVTVDANSKKVTVDD